MSQQSADLICIAAEASNYVKVLCYQVVADTRKSIALWKVCRFRPFVLLVKGENRRKEGMVAMVVKM
jgi:hypothetical protein